MADYILSFPPWSGSTFVPRGPHHAGHIPSNLALPAGHKLPKPFVAVITGASRGIGAGIAKAFASAGATGLLLTARKAKDLEATKQACSELSKGNGNDELKVVCVEADNGEEQSAIRIREAVEKEFEGGSLDLLVNNAGIIGTNASMFAKLGEIDTSQIEGPNQVNLLGRFYMTKHLLPLILKNSRPAKSIINVSSIGSHVSGPLGFSLTALATNRLSQRVAEAYSDQGVFSAAIHPGAVWPEVVPEGFPESAKEWSTENVDLAGAWLVWLVGGERKEWLNGRYLDVTWDVEELEKRKDEIVERDLLKMRLMI
ncbi:hypothetical protein CKM354_000929700 [Cercospora kikuchii]|uniref:NAD(P)-binding protein n=1 Tax=Cercospora kikuchii TaxID=84275 RepID=A0A9P3FG26_9PEZI|nr:uncharacterized protein CKM354_000929700 [Cercospora kikuchii]GIZ46158.1 hypothetical protein CKM354_000929700 [Cercospora kikuchii]